MTRPTPDRHPTPLVHSGMPTAHQLLTARPTRRMRRGRPTTRRPGRLSGTTGLLHDHEYAPTVTATIEGQNAGAADG